MVLRVSLLGLCALPLNLMWMVGCGGGSHHSTSIAPDVYVAGWEFAGIDTNGSIPNSAQFWKNNKLMVLTPNTQGAVATGIAISGQDVYIGGYEFNGSVDVAKYWKNGQATELTDGSAQAWVNGLFVEGNHVYVAGGTQSLLDSSPKATYWVDGTPVALPDGWTVYGICASKGDVYAVGFNSETVKIIPEWSLIRPVAKCWKNGVAVDLKMDGVLKSAALGVCVSDGDVYIAGYESNGDVLVAKYWKNGEPVNLTESHQGGRATSIAVIGSDVHVVGYSGRDVVAATYWKNGSPTILDQSGLESVAQSISVVGSDVFVAGYTTTSNGTSVATYWKNGVPTVIGSGAQDSEAMSIVAMAH